MSIFKTDEERKLEQIIAERLRKGEDPDKLKYILNRYGFKENAINSAFGSFEQPVDNSVEIGGQNKEKQKQAVNFESLLIEGATRPLGNTDARLLADGKTAFQLVDGLKDIITSKDFGPIEGRVSGLNPMDTEAQDKQSKLKTTMQMVGKFMEGGVLRKEDEVKYSKMLPELKDTPEVATRKMENVKNMLKNKLENDMASYSSAGFDVTEWASNLDSTLVGVQTPEAIVSQPSEADRASQWLQQNPDDPRAEKVRQKLNSMGYQNPSPTGMEQGRVEQGGSNKPSRADLINSQNKLASISPEASKEKESILEKAGSMAKKVGNFLGISKFGEGIGITLYLQSKEGRDLQKRVENGDQVATDALNALLEEAPTAKEVVGSAALTALNIVSGGAYGKATSLAGKVGVGAGVGYAYDVAGGLENNESNKDVLKPGAGTVVGGAIPILGAIKNAIATGGKAGAERVMNSVVKPDIQDIEKAILYDGKTLGKEMLDEGMKGTKRTLFKKSSVNMAKNEEKLQKILNESTATIKKDELLPYFSKLKDKLSKTPTTRAQKALETVDEAVNLLPDEFNLSQANEIKRNLYSELGDLAYKLDPNLTPTAETSKAMASGLRDLIEKKASSTEVSAINKKIGTFFKVRDGILDQLARSQRNNLAGVGTMGAIIEKTIGATAVKTYGANIVNKAAKILEKTGTGKGGKVTKVMIMNAIQRAKREEESNRQ